jgi:hypothetical protein
MEPSKLVLGYWHHSETSITSPNRHFRLRICGSQAPVKTRKVAVCNQNRPRAHFFPRPLPGRFVACSATLQLQRFWALVCPTMSSHEPMQHLFCKDNSTENFHSSPS